jgi:hypothetical protein
MIVVMLFPFFRCSQQVYDLARSLKGFKCGAPELKDAAVTAVSVEPAPRTHLLQSVAHGADTDAESLGYNLV